MKLKELVEQYGEYTVPQELIDKLEKPKPKSVWDLEHGDEYVRITGTGGVSECEVCTKITYDRQRDVGNVFLTKEEAEKDVERRKVETLLLKHGGRRWYKDGVANWLIVLVEEEDRLTWYIDNKPIQGVIYFDTEEQAKKAISEIGTERIKNALFEVR